MRDYLSYLHTLLVLLIKPSALSLGKTTPVAKLTNDSDSCVKGLAISSVVKHETSF